ncbi:MAG: 50S ribosomal protein L20 [Spirochaetia bacterium]|jgi:large subunit ribosomal protein L20|nr:50S ribosomal protein L20 [Spirochaetia bacterium]
MPRAVDGTRRKDRRKKILQDAKGFYGRRSTNFRTAKDAVTKAGQYAYRDRKRKKRDFRRLWITRISAAVQSEGLNYSQFMHGLKLANIEVNRKALSNMAIEDKQSFSVLVAQAKKVLEV